MQVILKYDCEIFITTTLTGTKYLCNNEVKYTSLKLFASQLSPSSVTVSGYATYQSDKQVKPAIYQDDNFYCLVSKKCKW